MLKIIASIKSYLKGIQKRTILVAMTIAFSMSYYIDPLDKVNLTEWNRTFCSAVLSGISIDTRIVNFYKYFFLYLPFLFLLSLLVLSFIYKIRPIWIIFAVSKNSSQQSFLPAINSIWFSNSSDAFFYTR